MRKIVFATNNQHKLSELRELTKDSLEILSLNDISCHEDIAETADTFEGNALIKARWVKDHYGFDCFADDSGLEVEALGGAPGVYSARYAGEAHNSQANMNLLLENMKNIESRRARFRTVIAYVTDYEQKLFEGIIEGQILHAPVGENGFGYDPIFMPDGYDVSFAQMTSVQKNSISHRGRAVTKLLDYFNR